MMRGQYFTIDVVVAGIVALIMIIMLLTYWHYATENATLYRDTLNKEAIKVSLLLFSKNGDFSIVNASSIDALKTANVTELANIIDRLNRSVYVNVRVLMDGKPIYGGDTAHFPEVKISRLVWDPFNERVRRIDIYVSRT